MICWPSRRLLEHYFYACVHSVCLILMIFNKTIFYDNSISRINLAFTIERVSHTYTFFSLYTKVYFVLVTYTPCDWSAKKALRVKPAFRTSYQIWISILMGNVSLNNYRTPCVHAKRTNEKQIIEMMRTPTHSSIVFTLHHLWSILLVSCEISYLMKWIPIQKKNFAFFLSFRFLPPYSICQAPESVYVRLINKSSRFR